MKEHVRYGLYSLGIGIGLTIILFIGNNAGWLSFTVPGFWQVISMAIAWPSIITFAVVGLYMWGGNSFVSMLAPLFIILGVIANMVYLYCIGLLVYKIKSGFKKGSSKKNGSKK